MSSSWDDHPSARKRRLVALAAMPPPKPTKTDVERVMAALQRIADDRIKVAIYTEALKRIAMAETVEQAVRLARVALVDGIPIANN